MTGVDVNALILTYDGYIPAQDVQVGHRVLTHRGAWRRVGKVSDTITECVHLTSKLHNQGAVIGDQSQVITRCNEDFTVSPPTSVTEICRTRRAISALPASIAQYIGNNSYWYVVGTAFARGKVAYNYISNGAHRVKEVRIRCREKELKVLADNISEMGFVCVTDHKGSYADLIIRDDTFASFIASTGKKPHERHLPGWLLSLSYSDLKFLAQGWLNIAGTTTRYNEVITTVDKGNALLLSHIIELGIDRYASTYSRLIRRGTRVKEQFRHHLIISKYPRNRYDRTFRESWHPVDKCVPVGRHKVRNLSVSDHGSFHVEGMAIAGMSSRGDLLNLEEQRLFIKGENAEY